MARTPNRDILAKYRKKITHSRKWRQEEELDDLWRRMVELYRGRHFDAYSDEDRMLINRAFATINVMWPSVSVNHPKITVSARREEDADKAVITEAVVNYWWKHYECQPEFRMAVKDMLIMGHGWIKVGYKYVEEEREIPTPEMEMSEGEPIQTDGLQLNSEEYDIAKAAVETELVVLEDRPFIERVSPFDIFVDPDATCEREMRWIAHRLKRPLKEVKQDKRYNKSARNEVQPGQYSKWSMEQDKPRRSRNPEDGYVEIWEFYDITKGTMSVFADGSDSFLINPVKMPYAFGHPFVMLRNYDVPEYFYPIGELEAIETLQHELNETRTQMMNHRKRFSRKWLFKESAFDPDGRNALQSQDDNVLVPVVGDEPLGSVIAPMPAVINPPEFYNQSQLISADIDTVSGVSEYMRGGMPEIRRTATEAAIMQDASNARSSEKLAIIELAIGQVARRLVALAQQFMTGEQVARIAGGDSGQMWFSFDRDYIAGEFDFEVEGGSTQPVNESFRRQMALQLVDAMVPFASAGIVDMAMLARHVLQYGFGVKTPEVFLAPPPQAQAPMDQTGQLPPEMQGQMPSNQQDMGAVPSDMQTGLENIPTGGGPMPSSIPPQVLAGLLGQSGALAPNTAPML